MSEITEQLNKQLKNNQSEKIIKDEKMDRWFTGREISEDVEQLKQVFVRQKIGYQDVVLICLPNMAAYPVITQAIWEVGAIMHPIAATTPESELLAEINENTYAGYFVEDQMAEYIQNYRSTQLATGELNTVNNLNLLIDQTNLHHDAKTPAENDLALIMNTSGTTGKPKRVGLSHKILFNAVEHDIESHQLTEQDTVLVIMPMFHINAQAVCLLSTRLSGGKIVVAEKFSASKFWDQVKNNHVTWVSVVPTIINILLLNQKANDRYSDDIKLRFVRSSSFSLPIDKLTEFQQRFHTVILEGYGMTETASQCTINPFSQRKIGSAGKPFKTEVAIVNEGKTTQQANKLGEIAVKGDHVISHYLDVQTDSFHNGWFLTGDLGYFDSEGYLFVKGRKKDIINHGGEKVSPAQVENSLSQLDFVKEVAVIATPDLLYGEAVTAVIISRSPMDENEQRQDLMTHATETLANYERPTRIYFVKDFPRNPTGKVLRKQLQSQIISMSAEEVHE
ncbi:AMP-binding protein [Companilactobacillus furfuricola]|uniref:AMP-binding protein n=1 Tax=Companilactobacillus furfuricola TaxID=1462575 RepID=UPI000F7A2419|nr:AMP-binding protein [Companilactobacillus furfuricola]